MAGRDFAEFFSGAGMFAEGAGSSWRLTLANDIDKRKAEAFALNHNRAVMRLCDVAELTPADVQQPLLLCHASPPCRDVSLAGPYAGLSGARSGAFFPWWNLMCELRRLGRGPRIVTLENVTGLLSSNDGRDLERILSEFADGGLAPGPMLLDAAWWTPQSRPRLVIVAADRDLVENSRGLVGDGPDTFAHPRRLVRAIEKMPVAIQDAVVWWRLPAPAPRNIQLADIIEHPPTGVTWHSRDYTRSLVAMMSPVNRIKLDSAVASGQRVVGCLFRRTRPDGSRKAQRAEIRFDLAGCLRVATGGSSRQVLLVVEGGSIRSRLMSPREAARLMGLDDTFRLPNQVNAALTVCGDGIAVPMVRHVMRHLIDPLADIALDVRSDAA